MVNYEAPQEDNFDTAAEQVNEDGSVDVNPAPEEPLPDTEEYDHYENLAEKLDEETLSKIATEVINGCASDEQSRMPWVNMVTKGLDLLGLEFKEMTEPFEGACGATHPLILESAVKFQARAAKELFPPGGPVKAQTIGKKTEEKLMSANRASEYMNYQINEEMEDYFPNMENLLLYVPVVGLAYKKVYRDTHYRTNCSEFVPGDLLVVPANTTSLSKCPRYTHIMYKTENDLKKDMVYGVYSNIDCGVPYKPDISTITKKFNEIIGVVTSVSEQDEVFTLLEQHTYLTLEGTKYEDENGLALPYIVTVEKQTSKVLSIRRNWRVDDPDKCKRVWFVKYPFVPGFGYYPLGFIHLLGNFELTLTMVMRSLVDAGQFANLQGGFKAKGVRIQNNDPLRPGEWKEMECVGMDITKSLLPVPYKEPSQTLFALFQFLEGRGQKFADSTEQVISDSTNYGPVGTTLALLEASTKFFSGIHKRLHFAQKQEFQLLQELNKEYLPEGGYPYDVVGGERNIFPMDFSESDVTIIPCSDPNISSNAHKLTLAQTKLQVAQQFPNDVNKKIILREFFACINDGSDPNELVPPDAQAQQMDPVSDIAAAVKGQPIQAFPGQDHDAHIKVKTLWLNDPHNGKNQMMAGASTTIQANIRDHMVLSYQEMMQASMKKLGIDPGQAQQMGKMDAAVAMAADLVDKITANKAELTGNQDPLLIAAQAEMLSAQNQKTDIEYQHIQKAAEIQVDNNKVLLEAKRLGIEDSQFTRDLGFKMVDKSLDRVSQHAIEKSRQQTALEVADKQAAAKAKKSHD